MKNNEKLAINVSIYSIVVNLILSVFKFLAGIIAHSYAMISDAIHSASDVFSTFVVIFGIKISNKQPDEKHKYGHERFECVTAILLAVILGAVGFSVGYSAVSKIIDGSYKELAIPGIFALIMAIVSIVTKEAMYWATIIASKKVNSLALKADAWHHRSDALSSIGSLIGIVGARFGYPIFDIIASLVICFFIIKVAFEIFMDSIKKMTDESCDPKVEEDLKAYTNNIDGVVNVDNIKTRMFGNRIYVDLEICCDPKLSIVEAHDIAENVHNKIEENFPDVKHVMIHVNPCDDSNLQ